MFRSVETAAIVGLAIAAAAASGADPFVYQGVLDDAGAPADGVYDLIFETYDLPTAGTSNGFFQADDVVVEGGRFEVEVDLSNGVDPGFRWLQIAVRDGASTGGFTVLSPRQFITAAPFASVDLNEPWTPSGVADLSFGDGDEVVLINRDNRIGNEFFGIGADTTGFAGMYVSTTGSGGSPFYGYAAGGDIDAYSFYDGNDGRLKFFVNTSAPVEFDEFGITSFRINADEIEATALTSDTIEYSTPQERVYSIPPEAFSPREVQVGYISGSGFGYAYGPAGAVASVVAPVNLPDGAVIDEIRLGARDIDSSQSLQLQFRRVPNFPGSGFSEILGTVDTPLSTGFQATVGLAGSSLLDDTIDNDLYSYAVWVAPTASWNGSSTLGVRSVEFRYTVSRPD